MVCRCKCYFAKKILYFIDAPEALFLKLIGSMVIGVNEWIFVTRDFRIYTRFTMAQI